MFAAIVASRPVITTLQTISPTQFAFNIPSQPSFSHIVIFLLPGAALSPGSAAAVYIRLPPSPDFRLLGAIANDKQSAIFKFNTASTNNNGATPQGGDDVMIDDVIDQPATSDPNITAADIVVGISVEPAEIIQAQLTSLKSQPSLVQIQSSGMELVRHQVQQQSVSSISTKVLAQRIIKNAFNFLSSFTGGSGGNETVPLKSFQDWWAKFEKKIDLDPGFLERDDQD